MQSAAIVLAAGQGTRMKSSLPKVAHAILGESLLGYVLRATREAGVGRTVTVVGHGADVVRSLDIETDFAVQEEQLGTGHAVMCAESAMTGFSGSVVVLAGDVPLIRPRTIRALLDARQETGAACVLLSAEFPDPTGYGRIIRDAEGHVRAIIEHKDLPAEHLDVKECNVGAYCFDAEALFGNLHRLEVSNAQGEYYLTDVIALLQSDGLQVDAILAEDTEECHGINTRVQLAEAAAVMQERINTEHMLNGVTMVDPRLVWVGPDVSIEEDVELLPMTFLSGKSSISSGAVIGPDSRVEDSSVAARARVDSSIIVGSSVGAGSKVGPRAYLRPGTVLGENAFAGASVEIKNSSVGAGSKVPHLSYIGDATIGDGVNVGAGSITCNYDGFQKHRTVIEDGAFVGSDTMLVAPVTIGARAVTGAGSAITRDVPEGSLAIERTEQRTMEGYADRRRAAQGKSERNEE